MGASTMGNEPESLQKNLQISCKNARFAKKAHDSYVWIRESNRNCDYLALKCGVFRGRSKCSTNSNPSHRILAG